MNPALSIGYRVDKMFNLHKKYGSAVIGVDFDHTLVDSRDEEFRIYEEIANLVREAKEVGCILCVWTANPRKELVDAKWKEAGLVYDYYNESPLVFNGVKPHFNLLLDDIAGLNESCNVLTQFIKKVREDEKTSNS